MKETHKFTKILSKAIIYIALLFWLFLLLYRLAGYLWRV